MFDRKDYTLDCGKLRAYAWPGGYPMYYVTKNRGVLCPDCANLPECTQATDLDCREDRQWLIVAANVNYEDNDMYCDHCGKQIEQAYREE